MSIVPATLNGVAILVGLLVPGIVYAAVRTSLQGFVQHDRSMSSRVVQAVMVSVVLDSVYLAILGWWVPGLIANPSQAVNRRPGELGLIVLGFGIVVPALIAYVLYSQARWVVAVKLAVAGKPADVKDPDVPTADLTDGEDRSDLSGEPWWRKAWWWTAPNTSYRRTPSAWDWIAPQKANMWIRVLTAEGRWIGGWSTEDTFFSSYPEPKDIYIPEQWDLDEEGVFQAKSESTSGVWLPLEGAQLVEWMTDDPRSKAAIQGRNDG